MGNSVYGEDTSKCKYISGTSPITYLHETINDLGSSNYPKYNSHLNFENELFLARRMSG